MTMSFSQPDSEKSTIHIKMGKKKRKEIIGKEGKETEHKIKGRNRNTKEKGR